MSEGSSRKSSPDHSSSSFDWRGTVILSKMNICWLFPVDAGAFLRPFPRCGTAGQAAQFKGKSVREMADTLVFRISDHTDTWKRADRGTLQVRNTHISDCMFSPAELIISYCLRARFAEHHGCALVSDYWVRCSNCHLILVFIINYRVLWSR